MQANLSEIKSKVHTGDFSEALALCEKAILLPDGKSSLPLQSLRAQCALQQNDFNKAENALLSLIDLPNITPPQIQKAWKSLADLYEQQQQWNKFIPATEKLFDINKSKGNIDRAQILLESISDAYLKIDKLDTLKSTWEAILADTTRIIKIIPNNIEITNIHFESWFFSKEKESLSEFILEVDVLLQQSPNHPWGNILKSWFLLQQGYTRSLRPYILNLLNYWQCNHSQLKEISSQKTTLLTDFTIDEIAKNPLIIVLIMSLTMCVICSSFDNNFHGINMTLKDSLHYTQEVKRRFFNVEVVLGEADEEINKRRNNNNNDEGLFLINNLFRDLIITQDQPQQQQHHHHQQQQNYQIALNCIEAFQNALKNITNDIKTNENDYDAEIKYRLGISQWLAGGSHRTHKTNALNSFLSCLKQDSNYTEAYSYIGHYYWLVMNDIDRASKCYLKTLAANPCDNEAGISLSQIYIYSNDIQKVQNLWNNILKLSTHAHWCFTLKAQYHLCQGELQVAVDSFQHALEISPNDIDSWLGLGTCYANLRQDISAQKALLKVIELSPYTNNMIALNLLTIAYERATYGWMRGAASSVIKGLDAIRTAMTMTMSKQYSPNKSESIPLSVSVSGMTRVGGRGGSGGNGDDNNNNQGSGTEGRGHYSCLWKLYGDLCCFGRHLSPDDIRTIICETNVINHNNSSISSSGNMEIIINPIQSQLQSKDSSSSSSSFEFPSYEGSGFIATSDTLLSLSTHNTTSNGTDNPGTTSTSDNMSILLQRAVKSFIKGIKILPTHSGCWNGLGLCIRYTNTSTSNNTITNDNTITNNALLSHMCYTRATQIGTGASTAAFANDGLLMVQYDEDEVAKECFSALQLMESNPLLWTILGISFERNLPSLPPPSSSPLSSVSLTLENSKEYSERRRHMLISAYDAYEAALEVAKPIEALLGSAMTWFELTLYDSNDNRGSSSGGGSSSDTSTNEIKDSDDIKSLSMLLQSSSHLYSNYHSQQLLIELRHKVEYRMLLYTSRRPYNPTAWILLARAYECRGAWLLACESCVYALKALEYIAYNIHKSKSRSTIHTQDNNNDNSNNNMGINDIIRQFSSHAFDSCAHSILTCLKSAVYSNNTQKCLAYLTLTEQFIIALESKAKSKLTSSNKSILTSTSISFLKIFEIFTKNIMNQYEINSNSNIAEICKDSNIILICARALIKLDLITNVIQCISSNSKSPNQQSTGSSTITTTSSFPMYYCSEDSPVRSYCRAVSVSTAVNIKERNVRRALHMDPSDKRLWGSLAALTFSDSMLAGDGGDGNRNGDCHKNENTGKESEKHADSTTESTTSTAAICTANNSTSTSDSSTSTSAKLILRIISYLSKNLSVHDDNDNNDQKQEQQQQQQLREGVYKSLVDQLNMLFLPQSPTSTSKSTYGSINSQFLRNIMILQ
eukprot:gene8257-16986_t